MDYLSRPQKRGSPIAAPHSSAVLIDCPIPLLKGILMLEYYYSVVFIRFE